jgi:DNA-binding LytR/AlgR family response regulator
MLKCIIVDDEQFSVDSLLSYIELVPRLKVIAIYLDPLEALTSIKAGDDTDIIFMDIDMPNLSGIELAYGLRSRTNKLVFTTAHSEYAFDAYEVNGDAFLLKPITFAKFMLTIDRLFPDPDPNTTDVRRSLNDHFLVKNTDEGLRILNVAYEDVIAFEGANNYVKIHTNDGRIITAYLTIADILNIVSERNEFKQFHRAFIVSTKHISYIEGTLVKLSNTIQFNVGDKFRSIFNTFIDEQMFKTTRKKKFTE